MLVSLLLGWDCVPTSMLPLLEFCLAWACTGVMYVVTIAGCVSVLLCAENTISFLWLLESLCPFFREYPWAFWCGLWYVFPIQSWSFHSLLLLHIDWSCFCVTHHPLQERHWSVSIPVSHFCKWLHGLFRKTEAKLGLKKQIDWVPIHPSSLSQPIHWNDQNLVPE